MTPDITRTVCLQFPRGVAALQITIGRAGITAELYAPRAMGPRPQLFCASAAFPACWRGRSDYPGDTLPEKLWVGDACIGLTAIEAEQVDPVLRVRCTGALKDAVAA